MALRLGRGLAALVALAALCPCPGGALHKRHAVAPAPAAAAAAVAEPTDTPWGVACPDACTCHEGPYREVPLRRLMASLAPHLSLSEAPLRSELDADRAVRQAVCVILSDTYEDVFEALPRDTQALTLLQSADDAAVVLTASLLSPLSQLSSLDVTAYAEAGVVLRSDAVRPLALLRLLSLTGVKLEGALEDDNEVAVTSPPPVHFRRRRLPPWAYRTDGQGEDLPQLVFLKPAEVVPFSKFSEIRRANALRTFDGLENLVMLRLHHADLVDLAWEMFNGLESLQVLSLEHNGLAYVPDWSLYGAPALRYLSLAHNSLLDVSSTALVGLLELRFLDLSHNNLSHLSELSLPPFPKLRGADFRGNPIEAIFTNTFQIMNSTETLLLGGSGAALQMHADMFLGLRALRRLAATDVAAPALHRDLLRGVPRLRDLTLRGALPSLPYDAFAEVPKLERLVLRQCGIRHVSMDAFYALLALQELDLSLNQLQSLPPSLLDQQVRLRELLLAGNQLKELPAGFLDAMPAKMVRLDGNPWDCSCEMASWNPTATNKDKREGRYVYDKRAAPTCATPERYAGWDVYDAMRRGFRCNKNPSRRLRPRPNALPAADSIASSSSTASSTSSTPTTPSYRSNVVPGRDDAAAAAAAAATTTNTTGDTTSPPAVSATPTTPSMSSSSPWSVSTESAASATSSTATSATATSSAATPVESVSLDATSASPAWSSTPWARGSQRARPARPARPGHRRGKQGKQRHAHAPRAPPDRGQEEGAVTKDGKYLLADGKGGFIAVSKKAYKAALEERRDAKRPTPTAAPPAAA